MTCCGSIHISVAGTACRSVKAHQAALIAVRGRIPLASMSSVSAGAKLTRAPRWGLDQYWLEQAAQLQQAIGLAVHQVGVRDALEDHGQVGAGRPGPSACNGPDGDEPAGRGTLPLLLVDAHAASTRGRAARCAADDRVEAIEGPAGARCRGRRCRVRALNDGNRETSRRVMIIIAVAGHQRSLLQRPAVAAGSKITRPSRGICSKAATISASKIAGRRDRYRAHMPHRAALRHPLRRSLRHPHDRRHRAARHSRATACEELIPFYHGHVVVRAPTSVTLCV